MFIFATDCPLAFAMTSTQRLTNFEASFGATDAHVAATAEIAVAIRLGVSAVRILDGLVRNKYASNIGKLAAWTSASHVEKDPAKKKPDTP